MYKSFIFYAQLKEYLSLLMENGTLQSGTVVMKKVYTK